MTSGALLVRPQAPAGRPTGDTPDGPPHAPVWVGQIEIHEPVGDIAVNPEFIAARLLVTVAGVAVGQVAIPLAAGRAQAGAVLAAVRAELGHEIAHAAAPLPAVTAPITIVVPTRGRPATLARCLHSVLRTLHRDLAVLVVDNDPADDRTARLVAALGDERVTYVREERRGTSAGRNRGLAEAAARGARFVAFVDDDVEVDPAWAGRVVAALAQPGVACVCGPVLAAELETQAQVAADEALGWRKEFSRRRYSLAQPPADSAIFPFSPGVYGVGANMAVDVAVARDLGGFDAALGPGTPARGGEDCEFMIRLVLGGHLLTHEPSAYAWHHHRPTFAELDDQMHGYALGLGGFIAKVMLDPVGRAAALRRIPAAVRQLGRIRSREAAAEVPGSSGLRKLLTVALGPVAYLRGRRRAERSGQVVPAMRRPAGR
jgi:GT2 family glycosyltransferase